MAYWASQAFASYPTPPLESASHYDGSYSPELYPSGEFASDGQYSTAQDHLASCGRLDHANNTLETTQEYYTNPSQVYQPQTENHGLQLTNEQTNLWTEALMIEVSMPAFYQLW